MNDKITGYSLTRAWFDWAFESNDVKPIHTALYLWIIELNNRLGWKQSFGLPSNETMEGLGIGNKNTYLTALNELSNWGFIVIVKESKNQYSSCVISICHIKNDTALYTALDTALIQQGTRHCNTIEHSTDTIDKQVNQETKKQVNQETIHYAESEILVLPVEEIFEGEKGKAPPVAPPPPKKSKPLKEKVLEVAPKLVEHTFAEDELSNTFKFKLLFEENYPTLDADYYYFKISKWLDTKTGQPPKRKVWASVINQFITNDYQKGNLQLSKQQQNESKREQFQQLNSDTDEWLERRIARRNAKYGV